MAAPPGLRQLAAAAMLTVLGLCCLAVSALTAAANPELWMGAGIVMLVASALLHWRSSQARR